MLVSGSFLAFLWVFYHRSCFSLLLCSLQIISEAPSAWMNRNRLIAEESLLQRLRTILMWRDRLSLLLLFVMILLLPFPEVFFILILLLDLVGLVLEVLDLLLHLAIRLFLLELDYSVGILRLVVLVEPVFLPWSLVVEDLVVVLLPLKLGLRFGLWLFPVEFLGCLLRLRFLVVPTGLEVIHLVKAKQLFLFYWLQNVVFRGWQQHRNAFLVKKWLLL